jgi:hypothetical protein
MSERLFPAHPPAAPIPAPCAAPIDASADVSPARQPNPGGPPVRRLRIADPAVPYGRTRCTLALDTATHAVELYLVSSTATATVRTTRPDAFAAFLNADPADPADRTAGFTVAHTAAGAFTVTHYAVRITLTSDQRAEVVAFLV